MKEPSIINILIYMVQQKAPKDPVHSIEQDLMDAMAFESIKGEKIGKLTQSPTPEACDQAEAFTQDVFSALYKMDPKVSAAAPKALQGFADQLLKLPEYQQAHSITQLDEIGSALGTLQLAPAFLEQIKKVVKRDLQSKKKPQKGQQPESGDEEYKAGDTGDKGDSSEGGEGQGGGSGSGSLEELMSEGELSQMRQALRGALERAEEKAENWEEAKVGWGISKGDLETMPIDKKMELAEMLTNQKKFRDMANTLGRFKNVLDAAIATSPTHGNDEIVDICQGSNIARMLPSELLKLRKTPKVFYKDLLEGKLLNYNLKGQENIGKGPIITCLDCSGSMLDAGKDVWAKSVVLSLLGLAEKQKRAFGVIPFESQVLKHRVSFWKDSYPNFQEKIKLAQLGTSGGTDFYAPLKEAFEMRQTSPGLKPADIVFITDGECYLSPEQIEEIQKLKKETEVRIHGIAISVGSYCSGSTLEPFCDHISVVNSLGEIDSVKTVLMHTAMAVRK